MITDPEVAALLELVEKGYPKVETMEAVDVRAAFRAREKTPEPPVEVGDVEDRTVAAADYGDGTHEIRVRVYQPPGRGASAPDRGAGTSWTAAPVVVFAHGGGFVFGTLNSHDDFCRRMSRGLDAVVVAVDYRLAPENRHPAALEDVHTVAQWVADHAGEIGADPARLVLAGDSAGGNLAACAALMARDRGSPAVRAQLLMYPMIVPGHRSESYHRFGEGYVNTAAATDWFWEQYLPGGAADVPGPYLSPVAADLAGLPPAVIITAECDPLHDDGEVYASRLGQADVDCWYRTYPSTFHGFATISALSVARRAQEDMWEQVRAVMR